MLSLLATISQVGSWADDVIVFDRFPTFDRFPRSSRYSVSSIVDRRGLQENRPLKFERSYDVRLSRFPSLNVRTSHSLLVQLGLSTATARNNDDDTSQLIGCCERK